MAIYLFVQYVKQFMLYKNIYFEHTIPTMMVVTASCRRDHFIQEWNMHRNKYSVFLKKKETVKT